MKRVLLWIFDPPWLLLIFGWPVMIVLAMIYAWPANMDEFVENAATPQTKLSVLREIRGAEERVVLEAAGGVLRRVARVIPEGEERTDVAHAQEQIRKQIEQRKESPSAIDLDDNSDKTPAAEDKPKADADAPASAIAPPLSRAEKRAKKRAEQHARELLHKKDDRNGFGISVNDSGKVHVDLGFVDQDLAKQLETTYGKEALPALAPELKQQIYDDLETRVHHFLSGTLAIILLILTFPLFVVSKIVVSILGAFSKRAEQSEKVAKQSSLAHQLTEARLAAMQAQIEPHFLFNTMASVQQLIETDPPAAAKMQADLIKYLRGAVPQMRESTSTLAREVELSTAYLDILKIRMEERLTYAIDVPPALMGVRFPPMMLPTLVENSIKHGLEPLPAGGEVRITAAEGGGKLRVTVADTGMGFAHQPGKGVGLANVRERLTAMYGRNAQLIIEPNTPRGARLTIEIPLPKRTTP